MTYKDKDKQREANKERQRRYKSKQKALLKGVTSEGVTGKALLHGCLEVVDECSGEIEVNLELCRTCGELLPELENPRKYPGKCYDCVFPKAVVK